jgi:hypothetical protein
MVSCCDAYRNSRKTFTSIIDKTNHDIHTYNVDRALATYQACLVPLHYHELWCEIVNDFKNVDTKIKERETIINVQNFHPKTTLDEENDSALIFGSNRVTFSKCLSFFLHLIYL